MNPRRDFEVIEIDASRMRVESQLGGSWRFIVAGSDDDNSPTVDNHDELMEILVAQRATPRRLGIFVTYRLPDVDPVSELWLYRGRFFTPKPFALASDFRARLQADARIAEQPDHDGIQQLLHRLAGLYIDDLLVSGPQGPTLDAVVVSALEELRARESRRSEIVVRPYTAGPVLLEPVSDSSWRFRIVARGETDDSLASDPVALGELLLLVEAQRVVPRYLWIDRSFSPSGASVWLYRGHFVAVDPFDAELADAIVAITKDGHFDEPADAAALDQLRALFPVAEQDDGPQGLGDALARAIAARDAEIQRRRAFSLEPFPPENVALLHGSFDPRTETNTWSFVVRGSSETENIDDETLATLLDLQWETPQLIGFSTVDGSRHDIWLFRGHYVAVDNPDADRPRLIEMIAADERFAVPGDEQPVRALRKRLPPNRFEREAREEAEAAQQEAALRRPTIPERVRHEVWRRDQGRCIDCGSRENLEFDHIIPFSRGGSNTARNLQLLCEACNRRKLARI
jgi:HNH endonuclease